MALKRQFKIHSRFKPAGDQPTAIKALVEGLNDGEVHQTLLGVTGSGKTFTIANVINEVQRPAMIMAPNKTLAAQLYGEMKFRSFFRKTVSSISSRIMTTISRKLMFRHPIRLLIKMPRSTSISNRCACQLPRL